MKRGNKGPTIKLTKEDADGVIDAGGKTIDEVHETLGGSDEPIPRFVLSLTDTKTVMASDHGDVYYSINVAADHLNDFTKALPKKDQTGVIKNEFQRMLVFMQEFVDKTDEVKTAGESPEPL